MQYQDNYTLDDLNTMNTQEEEVKIDDVPEDTEMVVPEEN